jgi:hypothetical protein
VSCGAAQALIPKISAAKNSGINFGDLKLVIGDLRLIIGNSELGIGHWALGIDNW